MAVTPDPLPTDSSPTDSSSTDPPRADPPPGAPVGLVRVVPAGRVEVARVVRLVESAYRGEASRRGWTTEADLVGGRRTDEVAVGGLVDEPATTVLVAFDGPALVGCCALTDRPGRPARLSMLAVAPDRQGGGVGRALLEAAVRRAGEVLGARAVDLAVLAPRPELRAWYARRGFVETGRTEPFPYGDERFGLPVRDDLVFVVLERPC